MEQNFKTLNIDNTKYKTLLTSKFENRKAWEKPDENKMLSFIPGTIRKVSVAEGQKVKEGEVLIILEAMKVENKILSPKNGIIKLVNIKTGDKVPKSHLLLEFK
ncbi:MAG: hypothetical protein A2W91_15410 [Bacteroidetes bacterium GWF2_38_335]|nr:MAG: hypothetical protein A2W91_15410 [Bacteroidetes bacterium GWF2_38_335]OFY81484.1 MAG: hypothetical protein A2281_11270 [Bacteroidetes bacterium RIFOXYA12_FULL_38_20]HBS87650.1 acetyl-CoA carboxylase biotin carboxyl carrier protein subunit [Bacteroidales bacterium]